MNAGKKMRTQSQCVLECVKHQDGVRVARAVSLYTQDGRTREGAGQEAGSILRQQHHATGHDTAFCYKHAQSQYGWVWSEERERALVSFANTSLAFLFCQQGTRERGRGGRGFIVLSSTWLDKRDH